MHPKPHQRQELQEGGHVGPIGDRRRDDHDAGHEEQLDVHVDIDAALKTWRGRRADKL